MAIISQQGATDPLSLLAGRQSWHWVRVRGIEGAMIMMKTKATIFACAMALTAPGMAAAEPDQKTEEAASAKEAPATELEPVSAKPPASASLQLRYVPPNLGRPVKPTGGATRGSQNKVPLMFALTPDHVGQTISAQPSLFWYVESVPDPSMQIEFTLFDQDSDEPEVETKLAAPDRAGIQRIRLADYGVKLEQGSEYEWSVTLIVDPEKRSKDVVVTGWIDRIEHSGKLTARLESEGDARSAAIYAEEGIWYDSFAALSDQIDGNPADANLLAQRSNVLRQVGLDQVAADAAR
jgi:hypothetical protein